MMDTVTLILDVANTMNPILELLGRLIVLAFALQTIVARGFVPSPSRSKGQQAASAGSDS